jgi:DNA repair protein RadC
MLTDAFFDQLSVCDNDSEILMKLIKMIDPSTDEGAFMQAVEGQFGGIMGLFGASYSKLVKNNAVGENLAILIKYMQIILIRTIKTKIRNKDLISNITQLYDYLLFKNYASQQEKIIIFLLNSKNFLLKEEIISTGTPNNVMFYPQTVIRHVIENSATSFILVHNHPSGDPSPSNDDVIQTRELQKVCKMLAINFHDHIIVGDMDTYSMRKNTILQ